MGVVKTFKEFLNEEWYNGPESHYRLRDMYANDSSFRRKVDSGTITADFEVGGGGAEPNIDEVYYGILRTERNEKFIKDPNKEMKLRLEVLNDDSHRLMKGSAPMEQIYDALKEMIENAEGKYKKWFENDNVDDPEYVDGWMHHGIYAKVGVKWGKDKNLLIGSVLKFFPDRNYMDEDVIESLRKK